MVIVQSLQSWEEKFVAKVVGTTSSKGFRVRILLKLKYRYRLWITKWSL